MQYFSRFFFFTSILFLFGCDGKPHPKDLKALIAEDDSIQNENKILRAELEKICAPYETWVDSLGSSRPEKKILLAGSYVTDMSIYLHKVQIEIFEKIDADWSTKSTVMRLKDMNHPGEVDITDHYFIGDDPENVSGKAKEIKEKINLLKSKLKKLIYPENKTVENTIDLNIDDVITAFDKKKKSWESAHFYECNSAEAYVFIDKLQNDVLKAGIKVIGSIKTQN